MFKGRKSLVLMMLAVLCMAAVPAAHGQEIFPLGDMETGGTATTAPDGWIAELSFNPLQTTLEGTVGVSSETRSGSGQSMRIEGYYSTSFPYGYSMDTFGFAKQFTDGNDYSGQWLTLRWEAKGDFYANFWDAGGYRTPTSIPPAIMGQHYNTFRVGSVPDQWVQIEKTFKAAPGSTSFSFYAYDATGEGLPAYYDNVSLTVAAGPDPFFTSAAPTQEEKDAYRSMFPNPGMEDAGFRYGILPISFPDYWGGGGAGTTTSSRDVMPGGNSSCLSISSDAGALSGVVTVLMQENVMTPSSNQGPAPIVIRANVVTENTEYEVSFWHKGDVRFEMPNVDVGTTSYDFTGTYEWIQETFTVTTMAGINSYADMSMTLYDLNEADGLATLIDNVMFALPEAVALLEGDANRDGVVSAGDYASVQANFGSTGAAGIPGDANGDGVVSAGDYASVQANFGATAGPVVAPEPATMTLIGLGGLALIRRRRK